MNRIYINERIQQANFIVLTDKRHHYVCNVLRLKIDDEVECFDGTGGIWFCKITDITKKYTKLLAKNFVNLDINSPLHISFAQGLSRGDKMDFTIQKATELGVNEITPILLNKTKGKYDQKNFEKKMLHWRNIIISACEQCGRNVLPKLNAPQPLNNWLLLQESTLKIVLDPYATIPLLKNKNIRSLSILIGGESGLTSAEVEQATNLGFERITLGKRILRTETAGVTTIAIAQFLWGDLS